MKYDLETSLFWWNSLLSSERDVACRTIYGDKVSYKKLTDRQIIRLCNEFN